MLGSVRSTKKVKDCWIKKKGKKIMTGLMILAIAVVAMAVANGSKKNGGKPMSSSTSMFFGNQNLNAGAAC